MPGLKKPKYNNPNKGLTKKEIKEELIRCGRDPVYFIRNYVKISHPLHGVIPFELYDFQKDCLRDFKSNRFNVVLKARQLGLSTTTAAYCVWLMLFHRSKEIMVVATKFKTAGNLVKKVKMMFKKLPPWVRMLADIEVDNKTSFQLKNGSQIQASSTSEDAGRSEALSLLIIDEAAHVEKLDSMWKAVYPTISCVSKDTYILTENGFKEIGDFFGEKRKEEEIFKIDKLKVWGMEGIEDVSHGYVSPRGKIRKIITKHGFGVNATLNHPLMKLNEDGGKMVQTQNLNIGDKLRIDVGMNVYGDKEEKIEWENDIKRIPKELFECKKEIIFSFLSKLFDERARIEEKGIFLSSDSYKLLREIQLLLLNMGIVSSIRKMRERKEIIIPKDKFYNFEQREEKKYFWDEIVSIKEGEEETFDLTVPETNTFLQNGILGHNTGGACIALSTPNGTGNWFHKTYADAEEGANNFNPVKLMWDVHPDRDQEWFYNETKNMTKRDIAQELMCNFNMSGETVFDPEDIERLTETIKAPLYRTGFDRNLWIWEEFDQEASYLMTCDVARGDGIDYSTFFIFKLETMELVAEYKGKVPTDMFSNIVNNVAREYGGCLLVVENNSIGHAVLKDLVDYEYENLYFTLKGKNEYIEQYNATGRSDCVPGFTMSKKTRPLAIAKMEEMVRNKLITIYSKRLISEMKTFVWNNGKPEAARSYNDDLIMACAIGCWVQDTALQVCRRDIEYKKAFISSIKKQRKVFDSTIPGMLGNSQIPGAEEQKNVMQRYPWMFPMRG